jgi:hypothetical protein
MDNEIKWMTELSAMLTLRIGELTTATLSSLEAELGRDGVRALGLTTENVFSETHPLFWKKSMHDNYGYVRACSLVVTALDEHLYRNKPLPLENLD